MRSRSEAAVSALETTVVKAIAIRRVSTKDQAENNHSLAQQSSSVQNMASVLEAVIVKDWGMAISGKKGKNLKRKDLQEALNYCRYNRGVKYLFIDKVSRFMREIKMIFYYMVEFEKLGVKLIFCDPSQQKFNADNADAMLAIAQKAHQAEAENEERSLTSTTKMQDRVRLGYYPFYPHQGYKKTAAADGLHVPDEPRFSLLQKALNLVDSLEMKPQEALRWLNAQGYTTPKGGRPLDMNHFEDIATDAYYAQILQVGDWPVNEHGLHVTMITKAQHENLVAIFSGRPVRRKRKHNPDFPLNLAMHQPCVELDGKLTGINHTNGKGWWRKEYVCRYCKKRVPRDKVHTSLQDILDRLTPDKDGPKLLISSLTAVWEKNQAYRIELVKQLESRLQTLNSKKSSLITALSANPDLAEDIKQEITTNKAEAAEVGRQLAEASDVDTEFQGFIKYALTYVENLRERFWSLPAESLAKCKQLLFFNEIFVAQDGIVYTPKISPIFSLQNENSGHKTAKNHEMVDHSEKSLHQIIDELQRWRSIIGEDYRHEELDRRYNTLALKP